MLKEKYLFQTRKRLHETAKFRYPQRWKNKARNMDNYQVYRVGKSKFADPGKTCVLSVYPETKTIKKSAQKKRWKRT